MKVLSFVIPAYNSALFLDKGVPTMLHPEIVDKLEIIIVNDGSTDDTAIAAQKYCDMYPDTVRLINQENKGHGGALNTGCAAATGKYIKTVDADDWVLTENLPEFVACLESCEREVVLTHYRTVDISNGEIKEYKIFPEKYDTAYTFDEILSDWRAFENGLRYHGLTYKTDFYRKNGIKLSEHVFYEDVEYATYPCCKAENLAVFDLFIYEYRIGDVNQSVSETSRLKRINHAETVLKRLVDEYHVLADIPGKEYALIKTNNMMTDYMVTALLINPDKKQGRKLVDNMLQQTKSKAPKLYAKLIKKRQAMFFMSYLNISKTTFDAMLSSKLYCMLKGKKR